MSDLNNLKQMIKCNMIRISELIDEIDSKDKEETRYYRAWDYSRSELKNKMSELRRDTVRLGKLL